MNNDKMSDNGKVASDVLPRYLSMAGLREMYWNFHSGWFFTLMILSLVID